MYYMRLLLFDVFLYDLVKVSLQSVLVAIQTVLVQISSQIKWAPKRIVLQPLHFVKKPFVKVVVLVLFLFCVVFTTGRFMLSLALLFVLMIFQSCLAF